jgi:hypothetical protein
MSQLNDSLNSSDYKSSFAVSVSSLIFDVFTDTITHTMYKVLPMSEYKQLKKEVEDSKLAIQKLRKQNLKLLRKIKNKNKIETI